MRFLVKSFLLIFFVSTAVLYISGCNTAEQTTGKIAFSQGDYEKAEFEFDKETKQNPNNEEAWFYLAISRFQLNKLSAAETALKEYRKLGKGTFDSDLIKIWGDKYDQGYSAFEKAKSNTDTSLSMPYYKQAIDHFKAALILMPDSVFVQKNIDVINNRIATIKVKPLIDKGADLIKEDKYEAAIENFKQAMNVGLEKDKISRGKVKEYVERFFDRKNLSTTYLIRNDKDLIKIIKKKAWFDTVFTTSGASMNFINEPELPLIQ